MLFLGLGCSGRPAPITLKLGESQFDSPEYPESEVERFRTDNKIGVADPYPSEALGFKATSEFTFNLEFERLSKEVVDTEVSFLGGLTVW